MFRDLTTRDFTKIADNAATDTTGVKLSYTAPATGVAHVVHVGMFVNDATTPTVQLQLVRGATTIVMRQDTASYQQAVALVLEESDVLRFNVTVAGAAGSDCDFFISLLEERV